ncbi:MAG: site-2 protease family protein [Elusimicrobia bacterium]|nr:site-2 protease family protein [Elusimicrobiota bacterium]
MRSHLVVGHVRGIEIGLHASWLVLAALVVSTLAGHFAMIAPNWGPKLVWTTAAVTSLCVFASLVLHELAHAAVARSRGIPVRAITLFALGGVAQIEQEAEDPRTEFWMGLAGPLASAAIGLAALLFAASFGPQPGPDPFVNLLGLVGATNAALAIFNLIPGFPLDGGRVLRAMLWRWNCDFTRSTKQAARVGQAVGTLLLAYGAGRVILQAGIGGLWSALLGWFLLEAATAAYLQADLHRLLLGVRAGDLMGSAASVEVSTMLRAFVDATLVHDGANCFVVVEKGRTTGLITPLEIAKVPRALWDRTTVGEAMRPLGPPEPLTRFTPAADALERMAKAGVSFLPIVEDGRVLGLLARAKILHTLETRRLM